MGNIKATDGIYLLLCLVFLGLSSTVGAVDIIFYKNSGACDGTGYSFNGVAKQVCCVVSASDGGSVLFRNMDGCKTSVVYKNGGCDSNSVGSGTGNRCYVGGGFTSGYWYQSCRRRSLLSDIPSDTTKCEGTLQKPSGLVYTENSKTGSWMLKSPDAEKLLAHLQSLPAGEKVAWLKAQGAIFDSSTAV